MRKIYFYGIKLFIICLIAGCTSNSMTKINERSDQVLAERVAKAFYKDIMAKDYNSTLKYFADTVINNIDTGFLFSLYSGNGTRSGEISGVSLVKCESKSVKKSNKTVKVFAVVYKVERSIHATRERLILSAVNNEDPKIYRYDSYKKK